MTFPGALDLTALRAVLDARAFRAEDEGKEPPGARFGVPHSDYLSIEVSEFRVAVTASTRVPRPTMAQAHTDAVDLLGAIEQAGAWRLAVSTQIVVATLDDDTDGAHIGSWFGSVRVCLRSLY